MKKVALIVVVILAVAVTAAMADRVDKQIDDVTWMVGQEFDIEARTFVYAMEVRGLDAFIADCLERPADMALYKEACEQLAVDNLRGLLEKNPDFRGVVEKGCLFVYVMTHEDYGYLFTVIIDVQDLIAKGVV